ncbi:MAG TPA: hypothetical protein PKI20_00695 [Verrucomicrobiota bacterium]|jgi:hypothetical protein|nr:hypothetical protein [Verrucomicrobiota bacterium]HQL76616.1 hypothetical protein [Verrucomicrobiota bacterium]
MAVLSKDETQEQAICRLLRCTRTHRYFTGSGWSEDPSQAETYPGEIEAVRACVCNGLEEVELVLRSPGTLTDLFSTRIR